MQIPNIIQILLLLFEKEKPANKVNEDIKNTYGTLKLNSSDNKNKITPT